MLSVRRTRGHIPDTSAVRATHRDVSRRLPTQPLRRDTIAWVDKMPANTQRSLSGLATARPPLHREGFNGNRLARGPWPSVSAARARASVVAAGDKARPLLLREVASGNGARVPDPGVDVERPNGAAAIVVDDDELAAVGRDGGIPGLRAGRVVEARAELLRW